MGRLLRIADLVRRDDTALDALEFEPDGKFQTRTVAQQVLAQEVIECLGRDFRHRRREDFPALYYACGKARVGSTPLNNLFGIAGMPSYYQPVKAIQRWLLIGERPAPWALPTPDQHAQVFGKETIGPYMLAECVFIPLQLLIEAGYPAEKLHLLVLDREPQSSLASWLDKLSHLVDEATLVRHYLISALNVGRIESYARRQGVPVTHYVYEASREPIAAARALFNRLGLDHRFAEGAVTDWKEKGELASEKAAIIYPAEPPIYKVRGLHGADTAYRYRGRQPTQVTDAQRSLLAEYGIFDIYRRNVQACARELDVDDTTAARLFGHHFAEGQAAAD
jgi:hypothetical protein